MFSVRYNDNYRYSYIYHGLDIQDKSFIKGIKIIDVDRRNPRLLKVTLERGNSPGLI